MIAPWNYRPDYHRSDLEFVENPDVDDWEDNSLSNTMAWASDKVLGSQFCGDPDGWPVRLVNYLWADCSCCLFFRGVAVGAVTTIAVGLLLTAII